MAFVGTVRSVRTTVVTTGNFVTVLDRPVPTAKPGTWTHTAPIRAKYPTPNDGVRGYCVGGAFMRYHKMRTDGFPCTDRLAEALAKVNPHLRNGDGVPFAIEIIRANDDDRIGAAWQALERALAY